MSPSHHSSSASQKFPAGACFCCEESVLLLQQDHCCLCMSCPCSGAAWHMGTLCTLPTCASLLPSPHHPPRDYSWARHTPTPSAKGRQVPPALHQRKGRHTARVREQVCSQGGESTGQVCAMGHRLLLWQLWACVHSHLYCEQLGHGPMQHGPVGYFWGEKIRALWWDQLCPFVPSP